jgi:hydroxymethylbilane synthase
MTDRFAETGPFRLIVSLNLGRHEILAVGGGPVAERKIATLRRAGAKVTMISPGATAALSAMARNGEIKWIKRDVTKEDFGAFAFAVIATGGAAAAEAAAMARAARCAADVCPDGTAGDFALCAQFETEGCFAGVSSGGNDPARAAALKKRMMDLLEDAPRAPVRALTRSSPLALAQANMWIGLLNEAGVAAVTRTVTSHGDRDQKSDLTSFGFGAFVKSLEDELLKGNGDCAVHSLKDMPVTQPPGLRVSATLARASKRDALVTKDGVSLEELPGGASVGTSSARRRAQILSVRPDIVCKNCRGNIQTRLGKLDAGEFDAIVLAEAALGRLGTERRGVSLLPFVTSAGQGVVAIETRIGTPIDLLAEEMRDLPAWYEAAAERNFLRLSGLGCSSPVAANASFADGVMEMTAEIYPAGAAGAKPIAARAEGEVASEGDAEALAFRVWEKMKGKVTP